MTCSLRDLVQSKCPALLQLRWMCKVCTDRRTLHWVFYLVKIHDGIWFPALHEVGMSPARLGALVAGQSGWHPLPHPGRVKEDSLVEFLLAMALSWRRWGSLNSGGATAALWPPPHLSDGAIPTKVQLVLWLLCPAPLAISEDMPVVIEAGTCRIHTIKRKKVLIEMEIFLAKNAPWEC